MDTYLLDANVIIRFLRRDEPRMVAAADALFARAERGEVRLLLDSVILAEVLFVLRSFYKLRRETIAETLLDFVNNGGAIETERTAVLNDALERYRHETVDFADAFLAALAVEKQIQVASFDRDFDRFNDVKRFEPTANA
jgi:predicted nucleic acid-binding protein